MKWNEAQERAIFTRDKNILVSAAAGSGKTAVLTERIKQLVTREGIGVDEMLIVTFTNAAAAELRDRISRGITEAMEEEGADIPALQEQLDRLPGADICTFHAFCLKVIRSYFYLTEVTPDFKICEDAQQEIFEQEAMDRMMQEAFDGKDPAVLDFLTLYAGPRGEENVTRMVIMLHRFLESLPEPEGWLADSLSAIRNSQDERERQILPRAEVLVNMCRRFREILWEKKRAGNLLGFGDVEHLALKILEQEEPARELREQYRCIFIDEYQDTNESQETLVRRICRQNNLFMVGDVKQSIYRFRLADPDIFIRKYRALREGQDPEGIIIDLNRNFRSKPPVLDTVNEIMTPVMTEELGGIAYDGAARLYPGFDYSLPPSSEYPAAPVEVDVILEEELRNSLMQQGLQTDLKREELEAMQAVRRIREVLGQEYYDVKAQEVRQVRYRDIVVLMRAYRGAAQTWQEVFQREGIPAYIEGDDEYFETVEILVFTNLLKLLMNRRQDIPLLSVLRSVMFGFTASDLAAVRIHQKEGLFAEAFLSYAREGEDDALRQKCAGALARLDRWSEDAGYLSLKDLLWKAADESGYYEFVGALPRGSKRQENLRDLIRQAEKFQKDTGQNLAGFLRYIDRLARISAEIPGRKPPGTGEDYVRMMSIHRSKGLEFPVVILAGAGKNFFHRKPSEELSLDKDLGLGLRYRSPGNEYHTKTSRQFQIDESVKTGEVEEEMRLLYVAMTRARERLFIIGSLKSEKARSEFGKKDPKEGGNYLDWIGYSLEREPENDVRRMQFLDSFPEPLTDPSADSSLAGTVREEEQPGSKEKAEPGEQISMFDNGPDPASSFGEDGAEGDGERAGDPAPEEESLREGYADFLAFRYPHPEATAIPAKFTATELNRYHARSLEENGEIFGESLEAADPGVRIPSPRQEIGSPPPESADRLSAAERGTVTHKVLQELELARTGSLEEIREQIREMTRKGSLSERESRGVDPRWILRFFESDLGRRMKNAGNVRREQEFLLWQPHDRETGSIVQGIIDCFFEDEEGLVLLDYKTDYIPDGDEEALREKAEHYRRQIDIYRRAVESAVGRAVTESYLYFLSIGRSIRMEQASEPGSNPKARG